MIHYTLKCDAGHSFDSWFQSSDVFDKLAKAGQVACNACGSTKVERALMAPRVTASRNQAPAPAEPNTPPSDAYREKAIAALRDHVEKNSEYVGTEFAKEARAMHLGDTEARAIWGEAKGEEARSLIEDGVPVAPLPFVPTRKTN